MHIGKTQLLGEIPHGNKKIIFLLNRPVPATRNGTFKPSSSNWYGCFKSSQATRNERFWTSTEYGTTGPAAGMHGFLPFLLFLHNAKRRIKLMETNPLLVNE